MAEQGIEQAVQDDPEFAQLMTELTENQETVDQEQILPDDIKPQVVKKFDAEELIDWWRTSNHALQPLTLDELVDTYEKEQDSIIERFEWEDSPEFSLTHLIVNGWLSQTAKLSTNADEQLIFTFKSIPAEIAKKLEEEAAQYARKTEDRFSIRAYQINVVITQLAYAWTAFNNEDTVILAKNKFEDLEEEPDYKCREKFINSLAQEFIDIISLAYGEFRKRSSLMIRGALQGN